MPVVGHLQKGSPQAENIVKLLRKRTSAHWPKPGSNATGHDDTKVFVVLIHFIVVSCAPMQEILFQFGESRAQTYNGLSYIL